MYEEDEERCLVNAHRNRLTNAWYHESTEAMALAFLVERHLSTCSGNDRRAYSNGEELVALVLAPA